MQGQYSRNKLVLRYFHVISLLLFWGSFSSVYAEKLLWPDLQTVAHTKGRPANKNDLSLHRAAFVLKLKGVPAGVPVKIDIPQYAIHTDQATGVETPVVIIQAEHIRKFIAYGYLNLRTGAIKVTYPEEIKFLGIKKPQITVFKNPQVKVFKDPLK